MQGVPVRVRRPGQSAPTRSGVAAASLVSCLIWSGNGRAQDAVGAAPIPEVDYLAPSGCPAPSWFRDELRRRMPRSHEASDLRRFRVEIQRAGRGYRGTFEVAGGPTNERTAEDLECAKLARALAVFVVLALDASDAGSNPSPPAALHPPRALPRVPLGPRRPTAPRLYPPTIPPANRWELGAAAAIEWRRASGLFFGPRVAGQLSRRLQGGMPFPRFRLSYGSAERAATLRPQGDVAFRIRSARAEACAALVLSRVHVSACGSFELGVFTAATSGLDRNGSAETGWHAPGLTADAALEVPGGFALTVQLGLAVPLQQARFTLSNPARQIYQVPRLVLDGGTGLAVSASWR